MGSHSETTDRKHLGTPLEELDDAMRAGFDDINRNLRKMAWKIGGLYVYLLAGLLWFYFVHLR